MLYQVCELCPMLQTYWCQNEKLFKSKRQAVKYNNFDERVLRIWCSTVCLPYYNCIDIIVFLSFYLDFHLYFFFPQDTQT